MGLWFRITSRLISAAENGFFNLGHFVGSKPILVISLMSLFSIFTIGLFDVTTPAVDQNPWLPDDSKAETDMAYMKDIFGETMREVNIYTPPALSVSGDASRIEAWMIETHMRKLFDLDERLRAITVGDDLKYKYEDICYSDRPMDSNGCKTLSVLAAWNFDINLFEDRRGHWERDLLQWVQEAPNLRSQLFEGLEIGENDSIKFSATILQYNLRSQPETMLAAAQEWELRFADVIESYHGPWGQPDQFLWENVRVWNDEVDRSVQGDVMMFAIGISVIVTYSTFFLGRVGHPVRSRSNLALAGVTSVCLAIFGGFGLVAMCGVEFISIIQAAPFVVLGVGVDDMFILTAAMERQSESDDVPTRLGKAMKQCCVTILMTSLTDFFALIVGAGSSLLAIRSFCIYSAVAILLDFILQVTFFAAFLALDSKRIDQNRLNCMPCVVWSIERPNENPTSWLGKLRKGSVLRNWLRDTYAPFLVRPAVRATVLIASVVLFGLGAYGWTLLEKGLVLQDLFPHDSPLTRFIEGEQVYLGDKGDALFIVTYEADLADDDILDQFMDLENSVRGLENNLHPDTWVCWTGAFVASEHYNPEHSFYRNLRSILAHDLNFQQFATDFAFSDPDSPPSSSNPVLASRCHARHYDFPKQDDGVRAMSDLRDAVEAFSIGGGRSAAAARIYAKYEQDLVVLPEGMLNIGLAIVCVLIITCIFLQHIGQAVLVTCSVVVIDVYICSLFALWNLRIDSIALINMVIGIGFSVDYVAHFAHSFMFTTGTRTERIAKTFDEMGVSIMHGGFSSVLAIIPMVSSSSHIFTAFVQVMFSVIFFALIQGLVVVPCALSWIGPNPLVTSSTEPLNVQMTSRR